MKVGGYFLEPQLVTVDVSKTLAPLLGLWKIQVAVLLNKTPRQIADFLRCKKNKDVIVFPFYTKEPKDVPNFRRVKRDDIIQPFYVGNLSPMEDAIDQIVSVVFSPLQFSGADVEIVLREKSA